jgi:uncharacterized surface protein with fasciclin (FAS1) repeats
LSSILFVNLASAQCGSHAKKTSYNESWNTSHKDIVDIAASDDSFSTLVTAVKAADLVSTLKSEGPFTVFAPNNIAFAKLPEGTVNSLLEESGRSTLTSILTYHVIPANITAESLVNSIAAAGGSFEMKTVNGSSLTAKIMNGTPVLIDQKNNKSFITKTDLAGSNGVIHVIDQVVMP